MKQERLEILSEIITECNMKPKQRKLVNDIIKELVFEVNKANNDYNNRIKRDYNIKSKDFIDYQDRIHLLLYILNVSESQIVTLNFKYVIWVKKHINEISKEMSVNSIEQLFNSLLLYECSYDDKMPADIAELKQFLLEPLKITEKDYDIEYQKALEHFKKTGDKKEILTLGWAKQLFNKIQ